MKKYITKNEKETFKLGKKFAGKLRGGEVVGFSGQLGTGKTVFIKGMARGMGIKKNIASPTFNIMKIYKIREQKSGNRNQGLKIQKLVHADAYRLENAQSLVDIGVKEYIGDKDAVVVIEWAGKVRDLLKRTRYIKVDIRLGKKENERIITVKK